jgi:hypothetical protein
MSNVQNCDSYINIASSLSCCSCLDISQQIIFTYVVEPHEFVLTVSVLLVYQYPN